MTRIAVTGATGTMGRTVRSVADARGDISVELAVSRSPGAIDGPAVHPDELAERLDDRVDVLVDFTVPEASMTAVSAAADAGVAAVSGTTGFSDGQLAELEDHAAAIPVLLAPNFSRGIQVLTEALAPVIDGLPGYDIEVTETHHNRKRDAPSGTADRFLDIIEDVRPDARRVSGREGEAPRSADEIGVHARRAGSITGEHEVLLAGEDEELRLVHRAESRRVFAAGALDAAAWIDGKPPGWYRFADVIDA